MPRLKWSRGVGAIGHENPRFFYPSIHMPRSRPDKGHTSRLQEEPETQTTLEHRGKELDVWAPDSCQDVNCGQLHNEDHPGVYRALLEASV